MLSLFPKDLKTVLLLGAHCDDIEIGCGASIQRLLEEYSNIAVYWVVLSSNPTREAEARKSAELYLHGVSCKTIEVRAFRNAYFPYIGAQIKDYFEQLKQAVQPDLVFTHYRHDDHQDHRVTSELTWNTFRNHFILEYEVPKFEGGLGSPNFFVPLTQLQAEIKSQRLVECFGSEATKSWFTSSTFMGLMRLRGVECNAPDGYAEAFYCRKAVLCAL